VVLNSEVGYSKTKSLEGKLRIYILGNNIACRDSSGVVSAASSTHAGASILVALVAQTPLATVPVPGGSDDVGEGCHHNLFFHKSDNTSDRTLEGPYHVPPH
jgi:hypothetical protein